MLEVVRQPMFALLIAVVFRDGNRSVVYRAPFEIAAKPGFRRRSGRVYGSVDGSAGAAAVDAVAGSRRPAISFHNAT